MSQFDLHERLLAQGYREQERWRIADVLGFVRRELAQPTWPLALTLAFLFAATGLAVSVGVWEVIDGQRWLQDVMLPFGAGCIAMILLVVPHELLHGLAYKLTGAAQVRYGADFSKLVFHASAPYHVVSAKQLYFVALLPLAVINGLLLVALLLLSGWWWWFVVGLLLMHTQGCLGDLAIVSFFVRRSEEGKWVTYDASATQEFVLLLLANESTEDQTQTPAH